MPNTTNNTKYTEENNNSANITIDGSKQDLYGYQPSINPNDSVELKDLGLTKSSKYSKVDTSKYSSVGSTTVQAGVPTNSLKATQYSSVGPVKSDENAVIAVRYGSGGLTEVKLDNGEVISIEEALDMAESGKLVGVHTGGTRGSNPHKTLVSNPDGDSTNNLSNLPRF